MISKKHFLNAYLINGVCPGWAILTLESLVVSLQKVKSQQVATSSTITHNYTGSPTSSSFGLYLQPRNISIHHTTCRSWSFAWRLRQSTLFKVWFALLGWAWMGTTLEYGLTLPYPWAYYTHSTLLFLMVCSISFCLTYWCLVGNGGMIHNNIRNHPIPHSLLSICCSGTLYHGTIDSSAIRMAPILVPCQANIHPLRTFSRWVSSPTRC